MRTVLLVAALFLALSMSGCLSDAASDGDTTSAGTPESSEGTAADTSASEGNADDAPETSGNVKVQQKIDSDGGVYYEASREETYKTTLSGASGTAAISTGAGYIQYIGSSGDGYRLDAKLKARGSTEQEARDRLAEMYIDHTATDGVFVLLNVHGKAGGDGSWNGKQIDLAMDAPKSIDWSTYTATAGGGAIVVEGVTASSMTLTAGGGTITAKNCNADDFEAVAGGGAIVITDTITNNMEATAGGGAISVSNSRANDMELEAGGGAITADMLASTASGSWSMGTGGGALDLQLIEAASHGYKLDATVGGGSITFDFDEIEETSNNCSYGYCSNRKAETPDYASRTIVVDVDLTVGGGSIHAHN
jgi:hypothetical protein